jgi:ketosteroid isomerase-like protein
VNFHDRRDNLAGTVSQENVDLVTRGYDDFNRGDTRPSQRASVQRSSGSSQAASAGSFHGPEAVANDVFATVPQNFHEFTCTVEDARDEGDTVVVTARFKGKNKSGAEVDTRQSMSGVCATARSCAWRTASTRKPGPKGGADLTGGDGGQRRATGRSSLSGSARSFFTLSYDRDEQRGAASRSRSLHPTSLSSSTPIDVHRAARRTAEAPPRPDFRILERKQRSGPPPVWNSDEGGLAPRSGLATQGGSEQEVGPPYRTA